jgi:hypothetical protein
MRSAKRPRLKIQGASHDRVLVEDNHIHFVRHREQGLTSRGLISRNSGVPQRGPTSGTIWLPEDDTQLGLEADGVIAAQEIDRFVLDGELDSTHPKTNAPKSRLAVSL